MAERATEMGVDIFTGTPAAEILYTPNGEVRGVATGDFGISKKGNVKENFQRGIEIEAKQTVVAEGSRGSIA
jgi:electron-transferring-flavoprotein dehydrogenase